MVIFKMEKGKYTEIGRLCAGKTQENVRGHLSGLLDKAARQLTRENVMRQHP